MGDEAPTNEIMCVGPNGGLLSPTIRSYPDGSPLIDFPRDLAPTRLLLRPRSLGAFMAGLFLVDALADRGTPVRELVLPFVPGARQDRLNASGDALFSAKSIAREINARDFDRVTVVDPHSDVTSALIDSCRVIPAVDCLKSWSKGIAAVVAPDGGSEKRAAGVAKYLCVPLLRAWKMRDVATGAISGFGMQSAPFEDRRVLVVDDICDGGGTFIGLAAELERARLTADLFVTHGLFSKGTAPLLAKFHRVVCTDSILGEKPGVDVTPICETLLKETP